MILLVNNPIPEYAIKQIEECNFVQSIRRCDVFIDEKDAVTYIHPESFDFMDVYGQCELAQKEGSQIVISKFEFDKNFRSFETEAINQLAAYGTEKHIEEEYGLRWSDEEKMFFPITPCESLEEHHELQFSPNACIDPSIS